jgi:CheY-like chemotaxis protein
MFTVFADVALPEVMSSKRVLVIDDEESVQLVVQSCLEDLGGWQVSTASSGQEGLGKAVREQPDAIVLDVMMPGMDGITFLERLKSDPQIEAIPVVLLTAKVEVIARSRSYGAIGAIAKPFDPMRLVEQVAQFLGWRIES